MQLQTEKTKPKKKKKLLAKHIVWFIFPPKSLDRYLVDDHYCGVFSHKSLYMSREDLPH